MKILYFIFLLTISSELNAQHFDIDALKKINVQRNKNLDGTMQFISDSQYGVSILAPSSAFVVGMLKKDDHLIEKSIVLGSSLAVNLGLTLFMKSAINRDRPKTTYSFIEADSTIKLHSFPSGHTSNAFCTATSLSLQVRKWYVILPSFAWASAVGYSRMHLGVHYPSDVAMGALLGTGSAWITYKTNDYLRKRVLKKQPKGYLIWQP